MAFTEHPLRRWAVDEMRLRRFAPVPRQCEIYQVVRLIDAEDRPREDQWLVGSRPDFGEWVLSPRSGSGRTLSGVHFLWERHTEASTLTLILPDGTPDDIRFAHVSWLEGWPGAVVRATRILVTPDEQAIDAHLDRLGIDRDELVCSDINANLRIWSDFGILADGYGRLLVTAGDVSEAERGRIIQRVQELGNYRNLALLGFPTVQTYGPLVDQLEQRLTEHARRVTLADEDDETLLHELSAISSQLELIRSETGFRLSATAAYAEVAADRLTALDVQAVANYQSLTDFTERRLVPATRTCSVFRQRLGYIAERISAAMQALDTRIDSRIKSQNLSLMRSMERSFQLQVRLQTLVESLSIIAAAYYLIGLIAYAIKGISAYPAGPWSDVLIGALVLPVVVLIYILVHVLRTRVLRATGKEGNSDTSG